MKKSSFIAMVFGTVSTVLFALGMCMALIAEWDALQPGIICGLAGLLLGLVTLLIWRKMEHKASFIVLVKQFLQYSSLLAVLWHWVLECVLVWYGAKWFWALV